MKELLLKCVPKNLTTENSFLWPKKGPVEAPDWNPAPHCGNGLHAWRWNPSSREECQNYSQWKNCKWLVIEVESKDIVDLHGKVKFRAGTVIYCGSFAKATKLVQLDPTVAGFRGKATAGDHGQATAGRHGQATAGNYGKATAGDYGQATAGRHGQATAGNYGKATADDHGQAIVGYLGQAIAGYLGQAIAGLRGTVSAGNCGMIALLRLCPKKDYCWACAEVDGQKIKPGVSYQYDEQLQDFVEVKGVKS